MRQDGRKVIEFAVKHTPGPPWRVLNESFAYITLFQTVQYLFYREELGEWDYWHQYERWIIGPTHDKVTGTAWTESLLQVGLLTPVQIIIIWPIHKKTWAIEDSHSDWEEISEWMRIMAPAATRMDHQTLSQQDDAGSICMSQGVAKRCRLSWLTNSALVYEPKCRGRGGVAGSQPVSTAAHMEPK